MLTNFLARITLEEGKCGGHPGIQGKRLQVSVFAGASFEEILEDYPFLEREDILAALQFAARQTEHPIFKAA